MTKLSPTQEGILKAAAKKPQTDIRESMNELKSPAIREKVLQSMLKNKLVEEAEQDGGIVYVISDAGLEAIGAKRKAAKEKAEKPKAEKSKKPARKAKAETEPKEPKVTKQQIIIDMLKRKEGATLKQMMEATDWQRHSLRGAMSGGLKKKLGLKIKSIKEDGGEMVYKIA